MVTLQELWKSFIAIGVAQAIVEYGIAEGAGRAYRLLLECGGCPYSTREHAVLAPAAFWRRQEEPPTRQARRDEDDVGNRTSRIVASAQHPSTDATDHDGSGQVDSLRRAKVRSTL